MKIMHFALIAFIYTGSCIPAIHTIYSFHEAAEVLQSLDENSLALFDVDYTITMPGCCMLWPQIISEHKEWLEQAYESAFSKSARSKEYLQSIWQDQESPPTITEACVVQYIYELQKRKVSTFALSAIMTGGYYSIASLPEWRFRKLQEVGINFSDSDYGDAVFTQFPNQDGQYPVLYRGILCSALASKGDVLGAFLESTQWKPSVVIFFDDSLSRLQEVERELAKRDIPFIGYHYHGSQKVVGKLDKEVALMQLNYLVQHERWIMEDEASMLLQTRCV